MEHPIQRDIILRLIHKPVASYSDLWDKSCESNAFAYHLKRLQEQGLIEKEGETYRFTSEGKKLSAFIEGDTGGKAELPTPTVIIAVRDGDRMLCQLRLKEPFYGLWGLPSGKINFGWNPKECAIRDLEEETGLVATDADLIEIEFTKSIDDGKLLHHHLMFTYLVTSFSGTLKERTHKAEHRFLTREELEGMKRFPGDWSRRYFAAPGTLRIMEKERILESGTLKDMRELSRNEYEKR